MIAKIQEMWDGHLSHIHVAKHSIEVTALDVRLINHALYDAGPKHANSKPQERTKSFE